jgi:RNA polymerase sigma-70 factor (ECF subfamily)
VRLQLAAFHRARGRVGRVAETAELAELAAADDLEQHWEQEWRAAVLRQCLVEIAAEVEPTTIAAFERFGLRGESAAAVAAALGMTVNAVYVAKHRVLQRVRELLPAMTEIW